jgi:hypothetical protein
MKVDIRNKESLYIEINNRVIYLEDSDTTEGVFVDWWYKGEEAEWVEADKPFAWLRSLIPNWLKGRRDWRVAPTGFSPNHELTPCQCVECAGV